MDIRWQRNLAAVETLALAGWTGGLAFRAAFADPALERATAADPVAAWAARTRMGDGFGGLELLFAGAVVASVFAKCLPPRIGGTMQKWALLAATAMAFFALADTVALRPRLAERAPAAAVAADAGGPAGPARDGAEGRRLDDIARLRRGLDLAKLGLGVFLILAHRAYEDRTLAAVAIVRERSSQLR